MADLKALIEKGKAALDALPPTVEEIAEKFRAEGIKGTPRVVCNCPVANYLKRELGDDLKGVNLWFFDVLGLSIPGSEAWVDTQDTPPHSFAVAFDAGRFPELVASSENN